MQEQCEGHTTFGSFSLNSIFINVFPLNEEDKLSDICRQLEIKLILSM